MNDSEVSKEQSPSGNIKNSNNPEIQDRVDTIKQAHFDGLPEEARANISKDIFNQSARNEVAKEIRIQKLRDQLQKEKEYSAKDNLTGLLHREPFRIVMETLMAQVDRDYAQKNSEKIKHGLIFAVSDIDDYGLFNKQYGTDIGDAVLREVGNTYNETIRESDPVGEIGVNEQESGTGGRLGGEEIGTGFLFESSPTTSDLEKHLRPLTEIQRKIKDIKIEGVQQPITSSFGITRYTPGEPYEQMYRRASQATKFAKLLGKDRIVSAQQNGDELFIFDTATQKEYKNWTDEDNVEHLKLISQENNEGNTEHYIIKTREDSDSKKPYLQKI